MPMYEYQCEFGHIYEEFQSISSFDKKRIVECPECGNRMESVIFGGIGGFVDNVTTVGQLGERNWDKLGKNRQDEMIEKHKTSRSEGAKRAGISDREHLKQMRKLNSLTKEQKTRYIHTGKLPP